MLHSRLHLNNARSLPTAGQGGAVLVWFILFLTVFLILLAMVVDLGRLEYTHRRALMVAESAGVAAVTELGEVPPDVSEIAWRKAKYAVLAAVAAGKLPSLDTVAESSLSDGSLRFDDTSSDDTQIDLEGYDREISRRGNLTLRVVRGVQCYISNSYAWFPLEEAGRPYCKANSVRVEIGIGGMKPFFAHLLGVGELNEVRVNAVTKNDQYPPVCGRYTCEELGLNASGFCACGSALCCC